MTFRNFSPQQMFIDLADEHQPECKFSIENNFTEWKEIKWKN